MNFKKLVPELVSGLIKAGFDKDPKSIQGKSVPQIKSGRDLYIVSPQGSGKSSALVIGVIQQLKEAYEDSPRVIIMAATKEKAFELEAQFDVLGKYTDLRTFTVFDKGIIQYQKDTIHEGLDILIGTPKRLNELLKINGIPLGQIKIFAVDDADTYTSARYPLIYGVTGYTSKSQIIVVADSWNANFEKLSERIMKNPVIVKLD